MESPSFMSWMPCAKALRKGQREVLEHLELNREKSLNVRLPTGYGKTLVAACSYSLLKHYGDVNRLLYIVPTSAQLQQFWNDGSSDLAEAGVTGNRVPFHINYSSYQAIQGHRNDTVQIFVTTIQSMYQHGQAVAETVRELMKTGRWMIVVDEYHHYGVEKSWGNAINALPAIFRLAMSATPYRRNKDDAFGRPDIEITYQEAESEGVVKTLECHSYIYQIDAILPDGIVQTFTTEELAHEAGSDTPEAIEALKIKRQMRWSPKYISPLIHNPLDRLLHTRAHIPLPCQALIGAMCCSHAELICDQIKTMYPYLRIDWVGTGPHGRTEEQNREIITAFCPPKKDGARDPSQVALDVLVHVGKAGEGLDSVFVTEIIHLNQAKLNNQNNQENGRAARLLPAIGKELQKARINVDSTSDYAKYTGTQIMRAMDELAPELEIDIDPEPRGEMEPLPEEPAIRIFDMRCIRIDRGEVERMAHALIPLIKEWDESALADETHPVWAAAEAAYRKMREKEAVLHNENAENAQWRDQVNRAVGIVTNLAIKLMIKNGTRFEKSLVGDIKKRVQQARVREFKTFDESDIDSLKQQWEWLRKLSQRMCDKQELPLWLQ